MIRRALFLALAVLPAFACCAFGASRAEATGETLTFQRVFKSSSPEFVRIVVRSDSDAATYEIRQLDEDGGAQPFEVGGALRAKIFELAARLHHFQGIDLDVHRKIAYLGEKTFRWDGGGAAHQTKFNYTLNSDAAQLLQIFEGLARQEENISLLEQRMKYDRLGINDALLQFESDLDHKLMPEPQRAVPVLEQIAGDTKYLEIARQRARTLADRLR